MLFHFCCYWICCVTGFQNKTSFFLTVHMESMLGLTLWVSCCTESEALWYKHERKCPSSLKEHRRFYRGELNCCLMEKCLNFRLLRLEFYHLWLGNLSTFPFVVVINVPSLHWKTDNEFLGSPVLSGRQHCQLESN